MIARGGTWARVAGLGLALAVVAGCARDDEAAMRARLGQWFSLDETVAFSARMDCAAAHFGIVDGAIKAAMPLERGVAGMLRALDRRGVAALDDARQAPGDGIAAVLDADRAVGTAMRLAALEARACMSGPLEGRFRQLLTRPRAVLAYDTENGAVMVLDRGAGVLLVAMGAS